MTTYICWWNHTIWFAVQYPSPPRSILGVTYRARAAFLRVFPGCWVQVQSLISKKRKKWQQLNNYIFHCWVLSCLCFQVMHSHLTSLQGNRWQSLYLKASLGPWQYNKKILFIQLNILFMGWEWNVWQKKDFASHVCAITKWKGGGIISAILDLNPTDPGGFYLCFVYFQKILLNTKNENSEIHEP